MTTTRVCRSCNSPRLTPFLDLGLQPLANNLLREGDSFETEPRFPLEVAVCQDCWLVQITETIPPVVLFEDYPYFSSVSDTVVSHARAAAEKHMTEGQLGKGHFVLEIASNDGYLLKNFMRAGIPCLGVEPAANIAEVARRDGVPTRCEFFCKSSAAAILAEHGPADLILGNNVFAHAPDINDFIASMAAVLRRGGRIALEFPYLGRLIEDVEFDTIYHEHVFYFSITALAPAFARHGLELFDVEQLAIHGGSLRLFVCHRGEHAATARLRDLLSEEKRVGVDSLAYYEGFGARVQALRERLLSLLKELKAQGHRLAAYGASAKGATLLNYFGLGAETLDFVVDRSTHKQGRLTPGTHLPVVAPDQLLARRPAFTLLLTWNFAEEILWQQEAYTAAGGRFIVPLPEPRIA